MTTSDRSVTAARIEAAVEQAGLLPLSPGIADKFAQYFDLLGRWNSKLNLTAIRNPEEVLQRHFLECIFCAQHVPLEVTTLLDYGSGGGFPGVPIALCRPETDVTLAESQGKKASFLREVVRSLELRAKVHSGRVEEMSPNLTFDAVALRAVDKMQNAVGNAMLRVRKKGFLIVLASAESQPLMPGFKSMEIPLQGSERRVLILAQHSNVPRETSI